MRSYARIAVDSTTVEAESGSAIGYVHRKKTNVHVIVDEGSRSIAITVSLRTPMTQMFTEKTRHKSEGVYGDSAYDVDGVGTAGKR
jgi:hypothetical protein